MCDVTAKYVTLYRSSVKNWAERSDSLFFTTLQIRLRVLLWPVTVL